MTPQQEKAREIVIKMQFQKQPLTFDQAKHCALIAVDEIMDELTVMNYGLQYLNRMAYWNEIKGEIEKL